MLLTSTFKITDFHISYGCAALTAAYVSKIYVEHDSVKLHIWVRHLKCSFFCYLFLGNTRLHYTYNWFTLSKAYVCNVYLQSH